MILLIVTGFSIHFPFWPAFMGIARGVHVFCGFILFINCIVRVIMAFFVKSSPDGGTRYQVTDYKTWLPQADNRHQLGAWIKYYLFLKKDHPLGAKLGVPQKISYLAIPILIIVMFYTGLALWAPTMNWAFLSLIHIYRAEGVGDGQAQSGDRHRRPCRLPGGSEPGRHGHRHP